jgi:hypothetical protein
MSKMLSSSLGPKNLSAAAEEAARGPSAPRAASASERGGIKRPVQQYHHAGVQQRQQAPGTRKETG